LIGAANPQRRSRATPYVADNGNDVDNVLKSNHQMEKLMADAPGALTWSAIATIALGSSVFGTVMGKFLDRTGSRSDSIRAGYADATKALNAWGQFPLRIRRRVNDEPETLIRLEALGAKIKEDLAYATGWVGAESREIGRIYIQLAELLRAEVTVHARTAWASPPAASASAMNVGGEQLDTAPDSRLGTIPAEWLVIQLFSSTIQYRIGWRRYFWVPPLLRWRLAKMRIDFKAEDAFRVHSARLLNLPPSDISDVKLRID
jgi:hypothetical protein